MKCRVFVGLVVVALMASQGGSAPLQTLETAEITGGTMSLNRSYSTGVNLKLKVTHTDDTFYEALVGPLPPAAAGASTEFSASEIAPPTGSGIGLVLPSLDGFVYMSGTQPYGGTDGGYAGSEGTSLIIQRITETGTTYHRYFRIVSTKKVIVSGVDPPSAKTITQDYYYVEKTTGTALSDPMPIPSITDPDPAKRKIAQFVAAVLAAAAGAGLPTP